MKNTLLLFFFVMPFASSYAQNVGIGINTPATNLHVFSTGTATIRTETSNANNEAALELKTNGAIYDFLELRKWPTGAAGSIDAVALNGLSTITTGANTTGGLLIGTKPAASLYLTTSNTRRLTISPSGEIGIGTDPLPNYKMSVAAASQSGLYVKTSYQPAIGLASAVYGNIDASTGGGSATGLIGTIVNGGISTGVVTGNYGVAGTSNGQGYGIGAFGTAGAGGIYSYVYSGSGKALYTYGGIQLTGLGEASGKVLTADATGNATWQSLSGSHNHFGETWSGSTSAFYGAGLATTNSGITDRTYGLKGTQLGATGYMSGGVYGVASSTQGIGVYGFSIGAGGSYSDPKVPSGVAGVASGTGTGVAGISYTGNGGYFLTSDATGAYASVLVEASGQNALELKNGFIKASGTSRSFFTVTASAANIFSNRVRFTYPNMSPTDIIIATHNYVAAYIGATGVWYDTGVNQWSIFREDLAGMPVGEKFTVMVIKQ